MSSKSLNVYSDVQQQQLHVEWGYDPALERPFLVIERSKYTDEEVDLYLYSNLDDADCEYTLDYFKAILLKYDLLEAVGEKNLEIMNG